MSLVLHPGQPSTKAVLILVCDRQSIKNAYSYRRNTCLKQRIACFNGVACLNRGKLITRSGRQRVYFFIFRVTIKHAYAHARYWCFQHMPVEIQDGREMQSKWSADFEDFYDFKFCQNLGFTAFSYQVSLFVCEQRVERSENAEQVCLFFAATGQSKLRTSYTRFFYKNNFIRTRLRLNKI